jgi:hypothetical protein
VGGGKGRAGLLAFVFRVVLGGDLLVGRGMSG